MSSDGYLTELKTLLEVEALLRPHAGFLNLKKKVNDALAEFEADSSPERVFAAEVFPANAGVIEEDTEHETPESDRSVQ